MAVLVDQLTLGEIKVLALDSDPRTAGGYAAEIGSFATINNAGSPVGQLYLKIGAGNTAWEQLSTTAANGTVLAGVNRRLPIYIATGNTVDDVAIENGQNVTIDYVAMPTRTTAINYQIPNPGDAITAASFVLTEGAQTINGNKTFNNDVIVNGNLDVNGTITTIDTVNLQVTDKLITLNRNGAAASAFGAGIELEENAVITGYIKTDASARTAWLIKAPASQEYTFELSGLTAARTVTAQDRSGFQALQASAALTVGSVAFVSAGLLLTENNANFFWDNTNARLGILTNSPQDSLHVAGNVRISGAGSTFRMLGNSDWISAQGTVTTTDATQSTAMSIPIPTDTTVLLEVRVIGRRTAGSAGAAGDSAAYVRTARFKNIAGTVTMVTLQSDYTSEDQAGWNCTLDANTTNARVRVTGAANNTVLWEVQSFRLIND